MNWITTNRDAVVAGVVSSVLVLLGQALVMIVARTISDLILRRFSARRLWGFRKPNRVIVVSGSIAKFEDGSGTAYLAGADAEAVAVVQLSLQVTYPQAEIVHMYAPDVPRDLYGSNIVTIGGPINNRCTEDFMRELGDQVRFDGLDLLVGDSRYEIVGDQREGRTDYGLIMEGSSPYSGSARWVVLAGCDSGGVLAAANTLSPVASTSGLRWRLIRHWRVWLPGAFGKPRCAVVRTKSLGNIAGPAALVDARELELS